VVVTRHRSFLRLLAELVLVGFYKDERFFIDALNKVVGTDKEHTYLSTVVTLAKNYSDEWLIVSNENDIISKESKEKVKAFFVSYFKSASSKLKSVHHNLKNVERANHEYVHTKGELSEEKKLRHETLLKTFEKLHQSLTSLGAILQLELPELKEEESIGTRISSITLVNSEKPESNGNSSSLFEDEDARQFYEEILDLSNIVPAALLGVKKTDEKEDQDKSLENISKGSSKDNIDENITEEKLLQENGIEEIVIGEDDIEQNLHEKTPESEDGEKEEAEKDEKEKEGDEQSGVTNSAALDSFLQKLPNLVNRDLMNDAAVEFCYINSKASRNKLIKKMLALPRNRLDLIPYYCRFMATLNPYMPDIAAGVGSALEVEFRHLLRRKDPNIMETRIRNIRFIAEMVLFKLLPTHVAFSSLKPLLDDFSLISIEVLTHLLEICGRYLYRKAETNNRLVNLLEILMKKKSTTPLDNRYRMMIENAYYMVSLIEMVNSVQSTR
jgi:regulator of nonsense transcripts 2